MSLADPADPAAAGADDAAERRRFHPLRIADVKRETEDAVSIAFEVPESLATTFRYAPGQYLTLQTTVDGQRLRRTYSIASGLDTGEWRIAIKRVEGGLFSAFANASLRVGDTIEIMPPTGRFVLPDPSGPRTVAAFAAGSGITPIVSQLTTLLTREPQSRAFLFYGNQTSRSILFREAIEDLKDRHVGRFSVHHVLSREQQDVAALNGRIDGEKIAAFMQHVIGAADVDHFLVCGPAPFIAGAVEALTRLGAPPERILVERFTTPKGRPPVAKRTEEERGGSAVTITLDGVSTPLTVPPGGRILDAAIEAGLDVPYSCRGGMCCTCRAKVTAGVVEMALNYSLRPDEIAEGFVLTCQSVPTTERVAVDYDAA